MKSTKHSKLTNELDRLNISWELAEGGGYYLNCYYDEPYSERQCWQMINGLKNNGPRLSRARSRKKQNRKVRYSKVDLENSTYPMYKPDFMEWAW